MPHIFKEGELVLYLEHGFDVLKKSGEETSTYPISIDGASFTRCGRYYVDDKYPTLLTVEQAAKLGYYPEKKKVKKWRWVTENTYDALLITTDHYSETEIAEYVFKPIQKIDSTEIEVDE